MIRNLLITIVCLIALPVFGQSPNLIYQSEQIAPSSPPEELQDVEVEEVFFEVADNDPFHRTLLKAATQRIKNATTAQERRQYRIERFQLRKFLLLPVNREQAKTLVMSQFNSSALMNGAEPVAFKDIDWEKFIDTIIALIPKIMQLIDLINSFADKTLNGELNVHDINQFINMVRANA